MMNTTRWSLLLALLIAAGCGDDGSGNNKNNNKPDLAGDMEPDSSDDMSPDMEPDQGDMDTSPDTAPPTVSITSGMSATAAGVYRLEGAFMDDRGVTALSYVVDGGAAQPIEPVSSPFALDVTLTGDATITVTARDAAGNEGSAEIMVQVPQEGELVADFTVSPMPSSFLPAVFDASGTMDPLSRSLTYSWDFGDGATGEGVKVGHLYREPGTYTVKLLVEADDGVTAQAEREVIVADPMPSGMATLRGNVLDAAGAPVGRVEVFNRAGAKVATTDGEGRFEIMAGTGVPLVYTLRRSDYTTQVMRVELPAGSQIVTASAHMTPRSLPVFLLDAAAGGTVAGPYGSRIEFAAGGLVDDETGMPVSGPVAVTITPLNHDAGDSRAFPGLFEAALPDGSVDQLISYGLMEVTLTQNGRKVQLAPGKPATVEIPYTVAQGQAGDTFPFWTLDERTGLWVLEQDAAPLQAAASGSGLVQRASVSHFSWLNIDRNGAAFNMPRFDVNVEFIHDNTPITEEVELDLDFDDCFEPGRMRVHKSGARSGDTLRNFLAGCDVGVNARSTSGRYFAEVEVSPADGSQPIRVEMIDAQGLTVLAPNTPVTGSLSGAKRYYAFDAAAASSYGLRLRGAAGATLSGQARLLSPSRIARPPVAFDASRDSTLHAAAPEAGLWVVEVSATSGAGDFTIELIPNANPLLNDQPSQSFSLAAGARRDLLVRASQADLGRIVASGSQQLELTVLNGREQPVASEVATSADTGLMRFPAGGVYLVRVTNNGAQANVTVDYAPAAPPTVLTPNTRVSLQRPIDPGQVDVFILPHYAQAGVSARVNNTSAAPSPQLSLYSSSEATFPTAGLTRRQLRKADNMEAVAAMRLPAVANEYSSAAFVYVSLLGGQPASSYEIDFDLVRRDAAITAGSCQGAHTPSLFTAALALADAGVLTACAEDHEVFEGLRFAEPSFTLRGADRQLSKLIPWPGSTYAISTGSYGDSQPLATTSATIEDLSVVNRNVGVNISGASATSITIQRANIESATPLAGQGLTPTACLTSSADASSAASVLIADTSCVNTQEAINLTSFDSVTVRQSSMTTTERGVVLNNAHTVAIEQNTFASSVQAISSAQTRGAATIRGNVISQGPGSNALGGVALTLTLRADANTQPQSLIQNNAISLVGSGSVAIGAGFNAAGGDLTIDGNKVAGANASQVAIRAFASAVNVVGGKLKIYNNIVRNVGLHAIHILQADALTATEIYNNSMRTPEINASTKSMINIALRANNGAAAVSIFNNIFYGGSGGLLGANGVAYPSGISPTRDYNLFYQVATPYLPVGLAVAPGASANDVTGQDPEFSNDDLQLNASSPAIDEGTSTNAPTTAYGGGARPVGAAIDIGAHER